jgi:hypothetical protein
MADTAIAILAIGFFEFDDFRTIHGATFPG